MVTVIVVTVVATVACTVATCAAVERVRLVRRTHSVLADSPPHAALATMSLVQPYLVKGLTRESARKVVGHMRVLVGADMLALTDREQVLAWDGAADTDVGAMLEWAEPVLRGGKPRLVDALDDERRTPARPTGGTGGTAIAPLEVDGRVVGAIAARAGDEALLSATEHVAGWISGQLAAAELDRARARMVDAEMRALRAQISPHFVFNCLATIASFIRTDPERARHLLLDFADFARYSFHQPRDFTTLSDELRSIDTYLELERARFGSRLACSIRVAPEILTVAVPFLILQPLVENAVRHGIEGGTHPGHITVAAHDGGHEARVSVEDDGVGMDPARLEAVLAGSAEATSGVGLANVNERMRRFYGADYGLVIDTAPGAGTKVSLRLPKYRAGIVPD